MEIGCYGTEGYGTEGGPKQSECVHCVFPTRVGMVRRPCATGLLPLRSLKTSPQGPCDSRLAQTEWGFV
jgi:hypothetical protein